MGHLSTTTLESGLMRAEWADCGRKPHLDIEGDLHLDELPVALLELSGGGQKSLEMSGRGDRISALLLIVMRRAVKLDLLCSQ